MENAIGGRWSRQPSRFANWLPESFQLWIYRFGFERGYMDASLDKWIVGPFVAAFRWADRQERRWTDWLSDEPSRESDTTELHPESFGETANVSVSSRQRASHM
jgi:NAD(P)H-quinone oxidoreductase subunit 5